MGKEKEEKDSVIKSLTSKQIKEILREQKDNVLIVHYLNKHGETFLVRKDNPTIRIGKIRRGVLCDFDTQIYSKPLQYYEFVENEF